MTELGLVDLPLPALLALHDSDVAVAEELIGLAIPDELARQTPIWTFMIKLLTGHPEHAGWTMHALVRGDQIIGNVGFKGAPDEDGEVELGYGIETAHRRRGYAVGGVGLLLARAAREPRVSSVRAVINPDNVASLAVIVRSGFQPAGERFHEQRGRRLIFRRTLPQ